MTYGLLDQGDREQALYQGLLAASAGLLGNGPSRTPQSGLSGLGRALQGFGGGMQNGMNQAVQGKFTAMQLAEMQRKQAEQAALRERMGALFTPPPGAPTNTNAQQAPINQFGFNPQQIEALKALPPEAQAQVIQQRAFAQPERLVVAPGAAVLGADNQPVFTNPAADKTFKVGDTRVIEMGDKKITQEWDGQKWAKLADAPRSTDSGPTYGHITTDDGIFAVNNKNPNDRVWVGAARQKPEGEGREFTQETKLRSEYIAASKPFEDLSQHWGRMQAAYGQKDGAGDIALVYSYMKMLDPTSVVREGEFATAQNAGGVPTQVMNLYNKVIEGQRLPEDVRQSFVAQGGAQFNSESLAQIEREKRYRSLATQYTVNPDRVAPDVFTRFGRPGAQAPAASSPMQRPALPANTPALPPGFEVVR